MTRLMIYTILFYQKSFGRLLPPSCRFVPTCSNYGIQAFKKYGFFKGLVLTIWRIIRCNPFNPGGHDPV